VKAVQAQLGVQAAGDLVEHTLAAIARGLVDSGVRQLVVAGGETSGACVQALGISQMKIGPQIDPGVPWCHAQSDAAPNGGLHLTLKSGNFGTDDVFHQIVPLLAMIPTPIRPGARAAKRSATCPPPCGLLLLPAQNALPPRLLAQWLALAADDFWYSSMRKLPKPAAVRVQFSESHKA